MILFIFNLLKGLFPSLQFQFNLLLVKFSNHLLIHKSLIHVYIFFHHKEFQIEYFQSNVEGELINKLHEFGFTYDGIILNAGAYTHTSIAIADAIGAIKTPVIEVHISNVFAREDFRQQSYLTKYTKGSITGFGLQSYELALLSFETLK